MKTARAPAELTRTGRLPRQLSPRDLMESTKQRGFSMLELMIVIAIGFTVTGIAVVTLVPSMTQNDTNTAYDNTLMALRNYQNLSVTNRVRYIVTFTNQVVPGYCAVACGVI